MPPACIWSVQEDELGDGSPRLPTRGIAGSGFLLRVLKRCDWSVYYDLSRDPTVVARTTFPRLLTQEQARQRAARAVQRCNDARSARYVIEQAGAAVGIAGLSARPDGDVEVYYALLPAGRGRGIAARAARLLAEWATDAGARRVVLVTFPDNVSSRRTATRAGFAVVGRESRTGTEADQAVELWLYQPGTSDHSQGR